MGRGFHARGLRARSLFSEQALGKARHVVERVAVTVAVEQADETRRGRVILERAGELAKRTFPADLLDDLAQRARVEPRLGGRALDRIARFLVLDAQGRDRLFGSGLIDAQLFSEVGDIDVLAELAEDRIEYAHRGDSCGGAAMMRSLMH
jgi:hypothetical protein